LVVDVIYLYLERGNRATKHIHPLLLLITPSKKKIRKIPID